ncbi:MAG: O-antigen ligase family protein [Candidatus Eiseniibacteriota bacterium]
MRTGLERVLDFTVVAFAAALPLSIAASEILLGVSLVAWLFTRPWTRPQAPGVKPLLVATIALASSWLLSSAFSPLPVESLIHARKLYSVAIVFLLADWGRDPVRARRFLTAALAGAGLTALLGFAQMVRDWQDQRDLIGVFSNGMTTGNVLATLVVVAAAALLWRAARGRERVIHAIAFGLTAIALVLALRRSAWLAVMGGALVLIGLKRARWLLAVPVLVALVLAFGPQHVRDRAWQLAHPVDETATGRVSLWKSGLEAYKDHPVVGAGLQDGLPLIARYRRADATFVAGHFHNNWVQIAVSTGTIGLLAYTAWMAIAGFFLWRAWRTSRSALGAAGFAVWVAFQIHGLFDFSFGDVEVVNQLFTWTGLGLAAARPKGEPSLTGKSAV